MSTSCPTLMSSRTSPCSSFNSESDLRTPVTPSPSVDLHTSNNPPSKAALHDAAYAHSDRFWPEEHRDRRTQPPPTTALADEAHICAELDNNRWLTSVPRHMIGVFRADPFSNEASAAAPDLGAYSQTSVQSEGAAQQGHRIPVPSDCASYSSAMPSPEGAAQRPTKRSHPDSPVNGKKPRIRRRRVETSPALPFPATGPLEMFSHEFMVETENHAVNHPQGSVYVPAQSVAQDASARWVEQGRLPDDSRAMDIDAKPYYGPTFGGIGVPAPPLSLVSYPQSSNVPSAPHQTYYEPAYHVPTPHRLVLPAFELSQSTSLQSGWNLLTHTRSHSFQQVPNSASSYTTVYNPGYDAHSSYQPPGVRVRTNSLPAHDDSYMCHLCPRSFQLPNGLALHLKWHDRVAGQDDAQSKMQSAFDASVDHSWSHGEAMVEDREFSRSGYAADLDGDCGSSQPFGSAHDRNYSAPWSDAAYQHPVGQSSHSYLGNPTYEPLYHYNPVPHNGYSRPDSALFPMAQQRTEVLTPGGSVLLAPLDGLPPLEPLAFGQAPWTHDTSA
ncbi:hypothetical protein BV25DRAFT_1921140 [Artomyces pyxidatus]|uniref:Uncharacterized protein n=1 Tax=Artomyces pyxidatus TaxID=48021 RepID=A0ACB8SIG4_9AGAM|nr:hypothetical protein BV25DRAFT_1921140 [Artomyces pyxidatus]